ncbi:MAG: cysteine hydrolase [Actinobacteria bacterium]|nr:MAG: cysteine hydrolase [Actinomycetota bacterium]
MPSDASPFTLRAAAGLPTSPGPLANSTLIVIDAQVEYTTDPLALTGIDEALLQIRHLLEQARAAGCPVIHVAHEGAPGRPFDPAAGGRIIDSVEPVDSEPVVLKKLPNAFAGTDLAARVDDHPGRPLVICGFMTHMCVSATARAAIDLGYETVVVSDATATRSLPSATGGDAVDASDVHAAALAALADRFSVVATTAEVSDPRK